MARSDSIDCSSAIDRPRGVSQACTCSGLRLMMWQMRTSRRQGTHGMLIRSRAADGAWSWCSPDVHGHPKQKEVVDTKTRVMKVCHGVAQGAPELEIRRTRTNRTVKCLGGRGFVGIA